MIFLHADDPPAIIAIKIELANARHFLLTTEGHRAELDRAIDNVFRRWDELTHTKGAV